MLMKKVKVVSSIVLKLVMRSTIDRFKLSLCAAFVLVPTLGLTALAQPAPELSIDRIFRYQSSSSGNAAQGGSIASLKKWLGAYQRIIRDDNNNYVVVFDRASLQLAVELKDSGELKGFSVGCPISRSMFTSETPEEFQKLMTKCNAFK
jgi:hypothetical protein